MAVYGTDKPDLRFELPIQDATALFNRVPVRRVRQGGSGGRRGSLHQSSGGGHDRGRSGTSSRARGQTG